MQCVTCGTQNFVVLRTLILAIIMGKRKMAPNWRPGNSVSLEPPFPVENPWDETSGFLNPGWNLEFKKKSFF